MRGIGLKRIDIALKSDVIDRPPRLGMHLLFYGKEQVKILGNKRVDELLREQSIKVI